MVIVEEFWQHGFKVDTFESIEAGREAILSRFVSNNVVLISSGSLTKEDNPGGSIIKIYSEDEDVREKIMDHILFTGSKEAYIET